MSSGEIIDEFLRTFLEKSQSLNVEAHPRIIQGISELKKEIQKGDSIFNTLTINGNEVNHFNHRIKDEHIKSLIETMGHFPYLVHCLDIRYQQVGDSSTDALNKLLLTTDLQYLNLKGNVIQNVKGLVGQADTHWSLSKLKCLDISENPIEDIMILIESLEENTTIASLNISDLPSLKTNELIKLAITLRDHPLKVLRISNPPINKLSSDVVVHFSEMLRMNNSLRILELSKCILTCHDIQILIQHGILLNQEKSSIRVLDLSGNRVGDDGSYWISYWLSQINCELQQLNLAYNRIGLVGGSHIAQALSNNKNLKSLNLSHNTLGDNALYEIAQSLSESNVTLQTIQLVGCKFDQKSIKSFYELQNEIRPQGTSNGLPQISMDLVAYISPNTSGKNVYFMAHQNVSPSTKQPTYLGGIGTHPVLDTPFILELLNEYILYDENENRYKQEVQYKHGYDQEEEYGEYVGIDQKQKYQEQYEQYGEQYEEYNEHSSNHYSENESDNPYNQNYSKQQYSNLKNQEEYEDEYYENENEGEYFENNGENEDEYYENDGENEYDNYSQDNVHEQNNEQDTIPPENMSEEQDEYEEEEYGEDDIQEHEDIDEYNQEHYHSHNENDEDNGEDYLNNEEEYEDQDLNQVNYEDYRNESNHGYEGERYEEYDEQEDEYQENDDNQEIEQDDDEYQEEDFDNQDEQ